LEQRKKMVQSEKGGKNPGTTVITYRENSQLPFWYEAWIQSSGNTVVTW
jgi:molybdenum-dependent DNA-binding transcriptional regulator ModE